MQQKRIAERTATSRSFSPFLVASGTRTSILRVRPILSPLTLFLYQLFALAHAMAGIILYVLLEEQASFISFW